MHAARGVWASVGLLVALGLAPARGQESAAPELWSRFPAMVWRQDSFGREAPEWVRSFGGVNVVREQDAAWVLEADLVFYVDHAAGRDVMHPERTPAWQERHDRWFETRDPAHLERIDCLTDTATRAACFEQLDRTLSARGGEHGIGLSLGDEVSLTPWGSPEDICLSASCRAAWRSFVESERAAGRTGLAKDVDPASFSTDAARAALEDGDTTRLEGWFLRRRFHQQVLLDLLGELAGEIQSRAPAAGIGLVGLTGQTAFGGVAIERILPQLDFAEAYRTSDARQLLATLRRTDQRMLQTIFATHARPAEMAWYAWESWMRGADGFVVWSDRELARKPRVTERFREALARIRSVHAEHSSFRPTPVGVAIVHSADSIALNWLRDARMDGPTWPRRFQGYQENNGTLERDLRGWWRLLEDCGAQPGAVPVETVGAASVERFPLLVLNHLAVVEAPALAGIEAYLEAGGALIVHGPFADMDRRGVPHDADLLERWRETYEERVHRSATQLVDYTALRTSAGREGAPASPVVRARERTTGWLDRAGVARSPWVMVCDDPALPWLHAWERRGDTLLCAAIPNLIESDERRTASPGEGEAPRLRPLAIEVTVEPGWDLEWIAPGVTGAPSDRRVLTAGSAALFLLRRKR